MLMPTPGLPTLAVLWHTCHANCEVDRKTSHCFTDLEKMGLHVVEAGVEDHLKIRRVWHFWYKLILVHHLQAFV